MTSELMLQRATASTMFVTDVDGQPRQRALRVRDLQHYYGSGELRKQVLFDNVMDVASGEIVIMTGPSGSGKTTLLTLIGTLRRVQNGSLKVLGRELSGASRSEIIETRREIGFIFQAHNLFESLTAQENVRMALELGNLPRSEMNRRSSEMLARLGLEHRIHYKPASLSGGQKQRVAIARGLVHRPKLILADEPTAALDEKSGREVVTLFQELAREQGCTILMVTHDNRILDVADRIVNMVDGRIKSDVLIQESSVICEFLRKSSIFSSLNASTLSQIADKMLVETYPRGRTIIQQGDEGDKFYLIRQGRVEITTDGQMLATLGPGDYFGETALMTGAKRNATVRALEPTVVYALENADFQATIGATSTLREELQRTLFMRQ